MVTSSLMIKKILGGLASQDDSWDVEINNKGSNPYISWVNLVWSGIREMLPCSETHLPKWVEQWACHWISSRFHRHFTPSSKDGGNQLQMTQSGALASEWMIVKASVIENSWIILKKQNIKLFLLSTSTRTVRVIKSKCLCQIPIFKYRIKVCLFWTVGSLLRVKWHKAGERWMKTIDECSGMYFLV